MAKKRLVAYGTCQAEVLCALLQQDYPEAYEYHCVPSYLFRPGDPLPDLIWDADVFLYQPLMNTKGDEGRRPYETGPIVRRLRRQGAHCIGFPYLYFQGYHPDYCVDPLNQRTVGPAAPWGLYAYGMGAVMALRGKVPAAEIIARTKAEDFLSEDHIRSKADLSLATLRENESDCDVRAADWIESNFRKRLLFHSVNHPTNHTLSYVYNAVLNRVGLRRLPPVSRTGRTEPCEHLGVSRPPLYPCVRRVMRLDFDFRPVIARQELGYEEYLARYTSLEADDEEYARGARSAVLLRADCPAAMAAGDTVDVKVTLLNNSARTWLPPGAGMPAVKISYHWLSGPDVQVWDGLRTELPWSVLPGDSVCVAARVMAPPSAGAYRLQWDPVIEGLTWFSRGGCALAPHDVRVGPRPDPRRGPAATDDAGMRSRPCGRAFGVDPTADGGGIDGGYDPGLEISMFDPLEWHDDRILFNDLVFWLGRKRCSDEEGGTDGFIFDKHRRILDQYAALWRDLPPPTGLHVLELGIHDGGSTAFWCELLRPARYAAADLAAWSDSAYFRRWLAALGDGGPVVRTHWRTDQADGEALRRIVAEDLEGRLDLVIDDASHMYGPTKASFETLFPLLRPGGQYVIEDWSWGCWPNLPKDFGIPHGNELDPMVGELAVAAGRMAGFLVGSGPTHTVAPLIARVTVTADLVVIDRGPADAAQVPGFSLATYTTRRP